MWSRSEANWDAECVVPSPDDNEMSRQAEDMAADQFGVIEISTPPPTEEPCSGES